MYEVTVHGERGKKWMREIGTATLPIISYNPIWVELPEKRCARVLFVDLSRLDATLMKNLARYLSHQLHMSLEKTEEDMLKEGVPILYEDVSVMITELGWPEF